MSSAFRNIDSHAPAYPEAPEISVANGNGTFAVRTGAPTRPPLHPATSLRRHKWLALAVFFALTVAGLPVIFYKVRPKYLAEAVVYVSPHFIKTLQEDREVEVQGGEYRTFVTQQAHTINRYDIVEAALAALGERHRVWQKQNETDRHAVGRLQNALDIHLVPDTYQVAVDLEGDKPEGMAELVNSVVDTYLATFKREEFYATDARLSDLRDQQKKLEQEVAEKTARRTELARELGVTAFTEAYPNPYDRLMITMRDVLTELRRNRFDAAAGVSAIKLPNGPNRTKAVEAYAYELASKDPAVADLYYYTDNRRTALLTASAGLGPQHPNRKAAEQEIAALEAEETKLTRRIQDVFITVLNQERDAEEHRAREVEQEMVAEVENMQTKSAAYSKSFQEGLALGQDLDRMRKQLDGLDDRVTYLSMESQAPGFVRLFSKALPPDIPQKSSRRKYLAVLLLASAMLACLAAVARDVADPRVSRPSEVEGLLGFPMLGVVPDTHAAGPARARAHILRIANRVALEQKSHGSRIFAFTGAKAGVGTTTLVTELAAALTRQGVPSLAVEANASHPDPRYSSGTLGGLTSALRGREGLEAVIVPGSQSFPDHVPVGPTEGAESLPELFRLMDVLRTAAPAYQLLLLDLPPIPASVDAEFVAAAADVAVLVIQAGRVTKPELRAAAKALENARPRAVAAVMNRVPPDGRDA